MPEREPAVRLTRWAVVTGAPCSGKTSVIGELARRHRLLDDVDRHVVGIDQQHHTVHGHASLQFNVSPPRSGFSRASPNGTFSGSCQGSRLSVTVPRLRGRP